MGLLEELKRVLGLDEEEQAPSSQGEVVHLQPPPASFGPPQLRHPSPEENAARGEVDRNPDAPLVGPRPTLDPRRWEGSWNPPEVIEARANEALNPTDDVMVPPPPERWKAAYVDQGGEVQPAENIDSARILAEAHQLKNRPGSVSGAGRGLGPAREPAVASAAVKTAPPGKASDDMGKADLLYAISKAAKPPEDQGELPNPTPGQQIHPEPTSPAGASSGGGGGGGGPLGSLTKMVMGSSDPRVDRLKEALARSAHMKKLAGHITGMGIGADLVQGTHLHGDQGKGLRDRADDEVRDAMLPTEFEQKNARFDTEQQRAGQDMRLREAGESRAQQGELRAEAGEQRAGAEELRKGESFKTQQGYTDAKSQTSANARASIESIYPSAWKRIPEEIRNNFSAKDVERIFGEVSEKNFRTPGTGRSGVDSRMDAHLAAQAKLPNAGKILDLNDVLATMEAGTAPGVGYIMNKDGWQNFLRTPQGVAFKQKTQAIINKHIKDTTGLVVRESEEGRIMGELGYGTWDDAQALDSGLHKMAEESQADLDQTLNKLPPTAKKLLIDQGAVPKIGGKYGKVIKGSTHNYGDRDNFNPREWLRKLVGASDKNILLGSDRRSGSEQDAFLEDQRKREEEESKKRGYRFD